MERIYLPELARAGGRIPLPEEKAHYLARVLRMRPGDGVLAFDGQGSEYAAVLVKDASGDLALTVGERVRTEPKPPLLLDLAQGLPKQGKLETVIQKAVELGVSSVFPFVSRRSVPRLDGQTAARKRERWQQVAEEAARQSGRCHIPAVGELLTLEELLAQARTHGALWLAYEGGGTVPLRELLAQPPVPRLTLVVGPEGGFDPEEAAAARAAGAVLVGLGPRILRTETAGMALLAVVQYAWGDL